MKNVKNFLMLMALALTITVMSCDDKANEDLTPQEVTNNSVTSRLRMMNSDTLNTQNMDNWSEVTASSLPQKAQDFLTTKYENVAIEEGWQTDTGEFVVLLENDIVIVFNSAGDVILEFDLGAFLGDDDYDEDWDEIPVDSLPQSIKDYVAENYPNSTIEEAAQCPDNNHYIVFLDSGEVLEFDADGNFVEKWDEDDDWGDDDWEEIEVDALAQSIKDYVTTNYPNSTIEEAGKHTDEDEIYVFLNTGEVLVFDKDGNFVEKFDEDDWDDDDYGDEWQEVATDSLPQSIKDYLAANYASATAEEAAYNSEEEKYYVWLDTDIVVVFDKDGNFVEELTEEDFGDDDWEDDCVEINVDDLPQAIKDYIAANYADRTIEAAYYSESDEEYFVELDNDLILIFDKDGNFVEEFEDDDDDDDNAGG